MPLRKLTEFLDSEGVKYHTIDHSPAFTAQEVAEAAHIPGKEFAKTVIVKVDHSMPLMREETFGPVAGVMRVSSDEEAVRLMNDSPYGLTASIWTSDTQAAARLAERVEAGTVLVNRCDYLDPLLAWAGLKDSGRGASLGRYGFESVTRPKSLHVRSA